MSEVFKIWILEQYKSLEMLTIYMKLEDMAIFSTVFSTGHKPENLNSFYMINTGLLYQHYMLVKMVFLLFTIISLCQ